MLSAERTRHLEQLAQAMGPLNTARATATLKVSRHARPRRQPPRAQRPPPTLHPCPTKRRRRTLKALPGVQTVHGWLAASARTLGTFAQELKDLVTGELSSEVGPAALSSQAAKLRAALEALASGDAGSGALAAGAGAQEAARKLEALVDAHAAEARRRKEAAAAEAARAAEVAHVVQVRALCLAFASVRTLWRGRSKLPGVFDASQRKGTRGVRAG